MKFASKIAQSLPWIHEHIETEIKIADMLVITALEWVTKMIQKKNHGICDRNWIKRPFKKKSSKFLPFPIEKASILKSVVVFPHDDHAHPRTMRPTLEMIKIWARNARIPRKQNGFLFQTSTWIDFETFRLYRLIGVAGKSDTYIGLNEW